MWYAYNSMASSGQLCVKATKTVMNKFFMGIFELLMPFNGQEVFYLVYLIFVANVRYTLGPTAVKFKLCSTWNSAKVFDKGYITSI